MREAPSLAVIARLLAAGATVVAYDPEAAPEARRLLGDSVRYASRAVDAADGADALVLITEWNEFRSPNFAALKGRMRQPLLFDGRNAWDPAAARAAGFEYRGIGRP